MNSLMTVALQHSLITPPGGTGDARLSQSKLLHVGDVMFAGLCMLGCAEASTMFQYHLPQPSSSDATDKTLSIERCLAVFALVARAVAVAACVMQQVPLHVTADGDFIKHAALYRQFWTFGNLLAALQMALCDMRRMLQSGLDIWLTLQRHTAQ